MEIESTKFNNPILKRIAGGDLSVVNDINKDNANITEVVLCYTFSPLLVAAKYGRIEVINRLLARNDDGPYEFPAVVENITARDNHALRRADKKSHYEIAYILARAQWPNGVKDLPQGLNEIIPSM